MASSKRMLMISALAAAIATGLSTAVDAGPLNSDRARAAFEAEVAARHAAAVDRWLQRHGAPLPPRAPMTTFVTSCEDDGSTGTLRDVLDNVYTGDTVDVTRLPCNRITLMRGYIEPNPFASTFTIAGPGMDRLTISGRNLTQIIYQSGNGTVYISDLSFEDGFGNNSWGGCLIAYQIPNGGFSLTRVRVSNCTNHQINTYHGTNAFGGGIMTEGELTLVDSIVTGNTLSTELPALPGNYAMVLAGGGAYSHQGPVTITNSVFSYNTIDAPMPYQGAAEGGGLAVGAAEHAVTITDSVFSHNTINAVLNDTSFFSGGGVFVYEGNVQVANLVVSGVTIDHNTIVTSTASPHIYGAGMTNAMDLTLSNSTIFSNDGPTVFGGGLMARGRTTSIIDSTISGNHAAGAGGGVFTSGISFVDNTTIAYNASDTGVGGLAMYGATAPAMARSSIIAKNTSGGSHPDVGFYHSGRLQGNHNLIGDTQGVLVPTDTLTGDPQLLPLADNGGPTLTHALQPTSPAIDAGSDQRQLEFDQRGPGYARVHGAAADIGAFETINIAEDTIFADGFDG